MYLTGEIFSRSVQLMLISIDRAQKSLRADREVLRKRVERKLRRSTDPHAKQKLVLDAKRFVMKLVFVFQSGRSIDVSDLWKIDFENDPDDDCIHEHEYELINELQPAVEAFEARVECLRQLKRRIYQLSYAISDSMLLLSHVDGLRDCPTLPKTEVEAEWDAVMHSFRHPQCVYTVIKAPRVVRLRPAAV